MQAFRLPTLRAPACSFTHAFQHRHSAAITAAARFSVRPFSTSRPSNEHYQTLDIPKDASRNQIKASFYKLSKQYHPDVNADPGAKEKFQAVSEAYAVLGDERKRRAYDRTLASTSSPTGHPSHESHHTHPHWSYDGRRRGATHAWEYSRRPNSGPRQSYYPPPPGSSQQSHPYANYGHHYAAGGGMGQGYGRTDPWAHPNVQRATGRRGPLPTGHGPGQGPGQGTPESVSVLGRAVTVALLVFLIATIGQGFSASAA